VPIGAGAPGRLLPGRPCLFLAPALQDLPFKDAKLPAPSSRKHNRFLRLQQLPPPDGLAASAPISTPGGGAPHASPSLSVSLSAHASEDAGWDGAAQSPEIVSRPMSPDGLGDGIFSSVFMDTGVEGLIYGGSSPPEMHEHRCDGIPSMRMQPSNQKSPAACRAVVDPRVA
jgi:hypothetical protein